MTKKTIKVVFESGDSKAGYEIDVSGRHLRVCKFDDNMNVTEVIKEESITDVNFFLMQLQTVIRGAF